jgi:hypothetical protein
MIHGRATGGQSDVVLDFGERLEMEAAGLAAALSAPAALALVLVSDFFSAEAVSAGAASEGALLFAA